MKVVAMAFALCVSAISSHASFCQKTNEYKTAVTGALVGASTAAGLGAGTVGTAAAIGVTAVGHSSGAAILTGGAGYIAGTIGATATAVAWAPVVAVGSILLAGGAGGALYLCRDMKSND